MKKFKIESPVLRRKYGSYYLEKETHALCTEIMEELFELGKAKKISVQISSEKTKQSVAFRFDPMNADKRVWPLGKKNEAEFMYFKAAEWIKRQFPDQKKPFTIHVTVFIHG